MASTTGYGSLTSNQLTLATGETQLVLSALSEEDVGFTLDDRDLVVFVKNVHASDVVVVEMSPDNAEWYVTLTITGSGATKDFVVLNHPRPQHIRVRVTSGTATQSIYVRVVGRHVGPLFPWK